MSTEPLVAVVIVNYNGCHLLDDCLLSLKHIGVPYEVVLVDNASSDESVDYVRQRYPYVRLVQSGANIGFGCGCNVGVEHSRAPFILLLNSDARLRTSLLPAIELFRRNPSVGVVGGRLTYGDGRFQPSVGLEHSPARMVASWTGLGRIRWAPAIFRREMRDPAYYEEDHLGVDWVSGALMLIDRQAWRDVGGMHPGFFMYVEDVDFCRRVRASGRRVAYLSQVEAVHLEGGGKEWVGAFALMNTVDSYREYLALHHGWPSDLAVRGCLSLVFGARALVNAALAVVTGRPSRWDRARAFLRASVRMLGAKRCSPSSGRRAGVPSA